MDKKRGIITKIYGDIFIVKADKNYKVRAKMNFKKSGFKLLVGDDVMFDNNYILEVLPRRNSLVRPPVSNIDQIIIVISAKEPDFNLNLLDKFICIVEYNNIKPIICLSKVDLLDSTEKKQISKILKYYSDIGYDVVMNDDIDLIKDKLKSNVTVFSGQSGVGKSTLLNKIDSNFKLKTGEVSKILRGKNTTRHVELLEINSGFVADSPGFSAFELIGMSDKDIRDNFVEFSMYNCKYRDCMHLDETECGVKDAVKSNNILDSRYNNYKKFILEKK